MDISQSAIVNLFSHLASILPDKWQRKRGSLGPLQVFFTIMCMAVRKGGSYEKVLEDLKRDMGEHLGWDDEPYSSSLSEARRKLSKKLCLQAFNETKSLCKGLQGQPKVRYKSRRILAMDGTRLALPAYQDVIDEFGCTKDNKGNLSPAPQGSLTAIWDVSTNTPFSWLLEKVYSSERVASYELVKDLGENDLLIADRGYPSRKLLKQLSDQQAGYLIRLPGSAKSGGFLEVREFIANESAWDREIMLHQTSKRTGEPSIRVRLMKYRLDSGEIAVFATNLYGSRTHRRKALCRLYCYRWDIETAFKEMKVWHGLENFKARYAEGIHQEVAGLMLFMLLTGEMEAQARGYHKVQMVEQTEDGPAEPEYRFNRKIIARTVAYLLVAATKGRDAIQDEFEYSMKRLWRYRQRRKHGRKFERTAKNPNSKFRIAGYNANKKKKKTNSLAE